MATRCPPGCTVSSQSLRTFLATWNLLAIWQQLANGHSPVRPSSDSVSDRFHSSPFQINFSCSAPHFQLFPGKGHGRAFTGAGSNHWSTALQGLPGEQPLSPVRKEEWRQFIQCLWRHSVRWLSRHLVHVTSSAVLEKTSPYAVFLESLSALLGRKWLRLTSLWVMHWLWGHPVWCILADHRVDADGSKSPSWRGVKAYPKLVLWQQIKWLQ